MTLEVTLQLINSIPREPHNFIECFVGLCIFGIDSEQKYSTICYPLLETLWTNFIYKGNILLKIFCVDIWQTTSHR